MYTRKPGFDTATPTQPTVFSRFANDTFEFGIGISSSIKQLDEDYLDVRTRLVSTTNRNGTYTQENIPYALRRLEPRKERKKILLIVTDAEEVESDIRFRRAVDLTADAGVELLGLGINTSFMAGYFDRFVELTDLLRFGEELLKLLRAVIRR